MSPGPFTARPRLNQLEERLSEQSETEKRLHELEEILRPGKRERCS